MPLSVDTRLPVKPVTSKVCAALELTQRAADYAFIGGAQVDMYGNLFTTKANYDKPGIRFPGAAAPALWRPTVKTIAIMALEKEIC